VAAITTLLGGPLLASTLIVPSEEYTYFWEAMEAAQPGDTIKLLPGTYGAGGHSLRHGLAILGSGASCTILRGGPDDVPMFTADNVRGVFLQGLTVLAGPRRDAGRGGAILCTGSELTIRNCVIACGDPTSGTAGGYGGAIYMDDGSSVSLVDCVLRDNRAYYGGAIYLSGYPNGASLTMTRCTLQSNVASQDAGALSLSGPGQMTFESCRFIANSGRSGGAITCYNATLLLNRCVFMDNLAQATGAALSFGSTDFAATDCVIANNTLRDLADHGQVAGGIHCDNSSVALTNCTIAGNTILEISDENLYRRGGGIFVEDSTARITNSIFWDNTQDISYTTTSELDVSYCNIEDMFPGVGITHEPPRFVDPENGDFRLLGDSPCIDQGLNHPDVLPETDIEGNPRVVFGGKFHRPDLGAYEYDPSTTLEICTQSLDRSIADRQYRLELKATGGFAPYSWSLLSGSLPPGLGLSSEGILSGSPTTSAGYDFTLSVANLHGEQQQRTYQLDVSGYRHWYVDATISSPGDGTSWETALDSLQDAVYAASGGDILNVAPGPVLRSH